MEKHEQKYCPKCNAHFICKAGDVARCQCNMVSLSESTRDFLLKTNFECLCKDCLSKIEASVKQAEGYVFPPQKEMLIEGLHYYKEGCYCVFTELYHYLRGYCCQSGCRHCVYGFSMK